MSLGHGGIVPQVSGLVKKHSGDFLLGFQGIIVNGVGHQPPCGVECEALTVAFRVRALAQVGLAVELQVSPADEEQDASTRTPRQRVRLALQREKLLLPKHEVETVDCRVEPDVCLGVRMHGHAPNA